MDTKYIQLFAQLANSTQVLASQVSNYNLSKQDEKGADTAKTMSEDFTQLYNKISASDFDAATLTRQDFAKLLVGALIVSQHLENQINNQQTALNGYKEDLIPKLEEVINKSSTTEDAQKVASEIFQLNN